MVGILYTLGAKEIKEKYHYISSIFIINLQYLYITEMTRALQINRYWHMILVDGLNTDLVP